MTRSEFIENFKVSLDTLRAHKVRTGLTLLGIVIGVTSVISVAAIIDGLNRFIQMKVEGLGSRTYFITRFPVGTDPSRMPEKYRLRRYFNYEDAPKLREQTRHSVEAITIFGTRAAFFGDTNDIRAGSERVDKIILRGAEPIYLDAIPMFSVESGRFLTEDEEKRAAPVVVLGAAIADSLFPSVDPVGKTVLLNGSSYQVIGVFARDQGFMGGPSVDQFAIIPLSNFRKHNPQVKELFMAFIARPDVPGSEAQDEVTEALRRIRKVPANGANDFEIMSSDFLTSLWNQLTGAIVILTGVISSIGLLVGGIGVMNIMLISVTERTKEIGVRKAIGARASDIRVQFLLEAVILTLAGGFLGIGFGWLIAFAVRTLVPSIPAVLSLFWVVTGVMISVVIGLFFGYWPANRAASLDPIACLRYE
jgi:putative ABC transport system permease protein